MLFKQVPLFKSIYDKKMKNSLSFKPTVMVKILNNLLEKINVKADNIYSYHLGINMYICFLFFLYIDNSKFLVE